MVWPSVNSAAFDSTRLVVGGYILVTASENIMLGPGQRLNFSDLQKYDKPIFNGQISRLPVTGSRPEKARLMLHKRKKWPSAAPPAVEGPEDEYTRRYQTDGEAKRLRRG